MKRMIILLILCLLAAAMAYSCTLHHEPEVAPMPTPEPVYVLEYVRGVEIQRRMR